ncbi:uncharacterized protein LOC119070914 isoform X2 [Bradysia coprophila]|uniref:uncharacterized protein LOC119070914 isoform X2 n=1 Tax=Bradysia coprophila TaxID=38358 RepID=UPI00187D8103|nr:uncharacterized protein LOC119070914 isoform X2 [Bradysia coprophila]
MDALSFRRVAGGSVIDNPPLFSQNGDILFTTITRTDLTSIKTRFHANSVSTIRAYSTKTGECIHDIEVLAKVVSIRNMPGSSTTLVGCTENGVIVTWEQRSRAVDTRVEMSFPEGKGTVTTFNVIPFKNTYVGVATWTDGTLVQMDMFDLTTGECHKSTILQLEEGEHKVAVSGNNHNIVAAIQNHKLFVTSINSRTGKNKSSSFTNAGKQCFTAIACHPVEETVAAGDVTGKIFIYHALFNRMKSPVTTLYHWHHNLVETIAFTSSGSLFYSGGSERVLVGWSYNDDGKNVLPRLNGTIVHIAVSSDNQQIAVSTDDNGIIVVSPQFNPVTVIQNFVRVADDGTPWPQFPFGLKLDPRTGYIVLNGRIGQVQFYSPHDRTFFNLDVTMENRLSLESDKILYNTRITHLACNVDWLVTAECFDDLAHFPEVRLKFWLFDVTRKTYVLSTQIETPHEGGVTALEFSSSHRVEKLLCASSGLDGKVKIWSLEESEVYSESPDSESGNNATTTRKYWVCREQTSYKNLPANALAFMSDGSTLAVGFGNTLCIYIPETLRIRAVLSAPGGQDGSTNKLIVSMPKSLGNSKMTKKQQELAQKHEKLVRSFLENDDDQLINDLVKEAEKAPRESQNNRLDPDGTGIVDKKLFEKIHALNELNYFQKLELFQKMGVHIKLPADLEFDFNSYVIGTMYAAEKETYLANSVERLHPNKKFIGQWMLHNYLTRRSEAAFNGLHLKNVTFSEEANDSHTTNGIESMDIECDQPRSESANPIRKVAKIKLVVFATGDSSHLVIVCTENRLLIWNTITLRLQSSWKISVRLAVVDPCTSLVAVNTIFDELYVLNPSKQYDLYKRKNLPKLSGMVWLPRREPRKSSLDVDWQSVSQLFLFTRTQEMLYLVPDNDEDLFADRGTTLKEVDQLESQTHFGAMFARQVTNNSAALAGQRNIAGGLVGEPTTMGVKAITNLQTHTMAPVHLLSYGFLTSMLTKQAAPSRNPSRAQNGDNDVDMVVDSETEENMELNRTSSERLRDNMVNGSAEEDTENRNAEFNRLSNEQPRNSFTFMSSSE